MQSRENPSLANLINELQNCDWYWPNLDYKSATKMLISCTPGTYLLRDSRSDSSVFSLSYMTTGKVLHSRADDLLIKAAKLNDAQMSPLHLKFEKLVKRCDGRDFEMLLYKKDVIFANVNFSLTSPLRKRDCLPSLQFLSRQFIVDNFKLVEAARFLPKPIVQYIDSKNMNPPIDECIKHLQHRAAQR